MSFRTHGAVLLIFILTVCTLVTDSRFVVLCHKNDLGIMGTIYSMATKALTMPAIPIDHKFGHFWQKSRHIYLAIELQKFIGSDHGYNTLLLHSWSDTTVHASSYSKFSVFGFLW